ncbi:Tab2/Atab2 family RNA-binding protein [Pleurocapsales cyanobacterium LEGE 10410]|nr:Tab2/Atab2 family RNA-binding protein [Pleurocapsales cyanobacterium LEGE 10410]
MKIWQADFYYLPSQAGQDRQWELVICDRAAVSDSHVAKPIYTAQCYSADANASWLEQQILLAAEGSLPSRLEVFRPQALGLLTVVAEKLGIKIEPTRNTEALKQILNQRAKNYPNYHPLALEKPPPQTLPEEIWGDRWQIANIAAGQIVDLFGDRPIPICSLPKDFYPINLNLSSDLFVPGIVVYGGRKSMQLARWIERQNPAFINYIPTEVGKSGGFVLETGLVDRWVFNTFESQQAASIAQEYERKKRAGKGLHFLLIQPDDSGMTYTAFWLLKEPMI